MHACNTRTTCILLAFSKLISFGVQLLLFYPPISICCCRMRRKFNAFNSASFQIKHEWMFASANAWGQGGHIADQIFVVFSSVHLHITYIISIYIYIYIYVYISVQKVISELIRLVERCVSRNYTLEYATSLKMPCCRTQIDTGKAREVYSVTTPRKRKRVRWCRGIGVNICAQAFTKNTKRRHRPGQEQIYKHRILNKLIDTTCRRKQRHKTCETHTAKHRHRHLLNFTHIKRKRGI